MATSSMTETRFGTRRILVIDDEARLAESLAALLRGVGYDVQSARSGPEGLNLLRRESYDLVITDIRMDEVDGFDIMRHLAQNCPQTGIIVITGHASTESAIEALHQRVADYIPKPFDFEFLRRSIESYFVHQEAEQLREEMIQMLTHDIKVPLTSILGFAQLIRRAEAGRDDPAKFAGIIVSNSKKVLTLLENYLTNTRMESGRLEVIRVPVRIADVIEEELELHALDFERNRVRVECALSEAPAVADLDEPLVTRAVGNLVNNAAKYTPAEGRVVVSAGAGCEGVWIEVRNTAPDLDEAEMATVFDRFRRMKSSRGIEGSGLGLHIVRCVAEAHGGRVECRREGEDVVFRLELAEKE